MGSTQIPGRIAAALSGGVGHLRARLAQGTRRRRYEELMIQLVGQVALMTEEVRKANLIQQYRLTVEQLDRTIDDPALADAMSTLTGLPQAKRRQLLFANREYGILFLAYRTESLTWEELLGHLRVLCQNPVFAEYWDRTSDHRRSLPEESVEARVGAAVDQMFEALADEPDEWWVVGP